MKSIFRCVCVGVLSVVGAVACAAEKDRLEEYYPAMADPLIGDYVGRWNNEIDIDPKVAAQVIGWGVDKYRIRIVSKLDMRAPIQLDIEVAVKNGVIKFKEGRFYGEVKNGVFTGGRGRRDVFEMKKVVRTSPTIGLKPPANAEVLYDGSGLDSFESPVGWEEIADDVFMVTPKGEYLVSKKTYRDVKLHLEFRLAHMPKARGQQRSNSGLFFGDEYEVQILDSYGLDGLYNECGALYKVSAPHVNATAPPLQWQTYDVVYRAPRYDGETLVANPTMTVLHNGVMIHNETEMFWLTGWKEKDRMVPHPKEPGHIRLQGHGNFVQFRNMWLVDLGIGGEIE
jgi:hypothetical protein